MSDIKKAVLAYSGGLDTSVILKWLQDNYQCEIVTFTADLGQGERDLQQRLERWARGFGESSYVTRLGDRFVAPYYGSGSGETGRTIGALAGGASKKTSAKRMMIEIRIITDRRL